MYLLSSDASASDILQRAQRCAQYFTGIVIFVALIIQVITSLFYRDLKSEQPYLLAAASQTAFVIVALTMIVLGSFLTIDKMRTAAGEPLASERPIAAANYTLVGGSLILAIWIWGQLWYLFAAPILLSIEFNDVIAIGWLITSLAILLPGLVGFGLGRPFGSQPGSAQRQRWLVVGTIVTALISSGGIAALFAYNKSKVAELQRDNSMLRESSENLITVNKQLSAAYEAQRKLLGIKDSP